MTKHTDETVETIKSMSIEQLVADYADGASLEQWQEIRFLADEAGRMDIVALAITHITEWYEMMDAD